MIASRRLLTAGTILTGLQLAATMTDHVRVALAIGALAALTLTASIAALANRKEHR